MIEATGGLNRDRVRIAANLLERLFMELGKTKMIEAMPDYVAARELFGALEAMLPPSAAKKLAKETTPDGEAA